MTCLVAGPWCPTFEILGWTADTALDWGAGSLADSAVDAVFGALYEAYLRVFAWSATLWMDFSPSPLTLMRAVGADFTATVALVASAVAVLLLLSTAVQVMWRRDGVVVADAAAGLFKMVLAVTAGTAVVAALWALADALTQRIRPEDIDIGAMAGMAAVDSGSSGTILVLLGVMGLVGLLLSMVMILVMAFRTGTVAVLALLLPIAAAGGLGQSTKAWLPKVTGWLLALIFLKPMVAAIYRIGVDLMAAQPGEPVGAAQCASMTGPDAARCQLSLLPGGDMWDGQQAAGAAAASMLIGMVMMIVALLALPAMLRLFTWMFGGGPGGPGMGAAAGAAGAAAMMAARGRSRGSAPTGAADPAAAPPPGPPPAGPPPGGPPPAGGATAGATTGGSTPPVPAPAGAGAAGGQAAAGAAGGPAGAVVAAAGTLVLGAAKHAAAAGSGSPDPEGSA